MNIVIAVMLVFAVIGLIDKILGGRFRLAQEFDRGAEMMGSIFLALIGVYCMGVFLAETYAVPISHLASVLPFDPAVIIGSLLSPDMGGLPVSLQIASTRQVGLFCGMVIGTAVGVTVCFQLPVCLSVLHEKEDVDLMMRGLVIGLITILPGIVLGALVLHLPLSDFIRNTIPVIILCAVLAAGFIFSARIVSAILGAFGNIVRIISLIFFAIVMAGVFIPRLALADYDLVVDAFISVGKMMVVIAGALVFSRVLMITCKGPLNRIASRMGTNEYAVMGLILSMTATFAMLPLFSKMDRRGKFINAAFSTAGAYLIGGQMAFCSSLTTGKEITAYFAMKIAAGLCAIVVACLIEKNPKTVDKANV